MTGVMLSLYGIFTEQFNIVELNVPNWIEGVHFKLRNITLVATKVQGILRSYVVLTWMRDKRELVWHVTLWNTTKSTL